MPAAHRYPGPWLGCDREPAVDPRAAPGAPAAAGRHRPGPRWSASRLWLVALALTLLVPALHEGERSWWPWVCVAALVGGLLALTYVRRGRGNAETA